MQSLLNGYRILSTHHFLYVTTTSDGGYIHKDVDIANRNNFCPSWCFFGGSESKPPTVTFT